MSDPHMTIREMCDTFGVTARTLRYYEAKELLAPIRQGQKRLYTKRDRARLKLIRRGKRFGISLEEIRQLLDLYDLDARAQFRQSYATGVKRLAEMKQQRAELDESIIELGELLERAAKIIAARIDKKTDK